MQTVTAKDIATKIQRQGEPLQVAVDRLRNWTREGLMKLAGEKHPGTGRARQYPRRVMFDATLLQLLIDGTGMSAVNAGALLKEATRLITSQTLAAKCKGVLFLIARSLDWSEGLYLIGPKKLVDEAMDANGPVDSHTIINLELIYQRAFPEKD